MKEMSKANTATVVSSNNAPSGSGNQRVSDFETAIAACGFGCFNICLVIASMSTAISVLFTTSSLSFILPIAQCDLKLTLMDKGYLNAMSFAGMISSAVLWGYVADTMGRKIVMVFALLVDGIIVICCGISQTLIQLLVFKFFDGFMICGPFAVIMSYISEFHGIKHRGRMLMIVGLNFSAASFVLPILAIWIMPYRFNLEVLSLQLNTWHLFLLVTAIMPFCGGILNSFLPETPKFLMSQGRNDKALECLRTIYAINNRKPRSEYPISNLIKEDPEKSKLHLAHISLEYKTTRNTIAYKSQQAKEQFLEGLHQLRPMFSSPYLKYSVQVYSIYFCILLGLNSLRLWLPQIFATLEEFESTDVGSSNMCTILEHNYKTHTLSSNKTHDCNLEHLSITSYIDNLIVAVVSFLFYLLAIIFINKLGSDVLLKISLCLAFFSGMSMYFSCSRVMILIAAATYIGAVCVAASTVVYVAVNLFPTQMRTMVIIVMMTFGRFGSLLGNILFPFFVSMGCIPPFVQLGGIVTVAFILSLFLPNATNAALK